MSSTATQASTDRGRLPVARRDKRPALAALALLLILVGALGSALLVFRSGDRLEVLAARDDIAFGQTITAADLKTVRAAADDPNAVFEARFIKGLIDSRATSAIPAGTLVNARMFRPADEGFIPGGSESVGIVIDATRRPSAVPRAGDVIRLYYVSGSASDPGPDNPIVVSAARVMAVGRGSGAGTRSLTLLVRSSVAPQVTDYASSGNLAVTVLPDSTAPVVDFEK